MDPQRKRLSVAKSNPAARGAAAEAAADESLADAFGTLEGETVWICSKTDAQKQKKRSFAQKDEVRQFLEPGKEVERDAENPKAKDLIKGVFWACKKGLKPESPNQDSFTFVRAKDEFALYGVFDGHGPAGHDVSDFAHKRLVKEFINHADRVANPEKALTDSFNATQAAIEDQVRQLQADSSGTTCTMAYHDLKSNKLTIAHIGDSRAALRLNGSGTEFSTEDHKPNLPEEKRRIESKGGRVVFDGYYNYRVFAKSGMYPGLNMSRVFGDVRGHKEAGLTAEPEVKTIQLAADSKPLLVLCSDGVWEFLKEEDAFKTIGETPEKLTEKGVNDLAQMSWDKWMEDSDNEISDDITVLAVSL